MNIIYLELVLKHLKYEKNEVVGLKKNENSFWADLGLGWTRNY